MANARLIWKWVKRIWITAGLTFTVVFSGWSIIAYRASGEAKDATRSDVTVTAVEGDGSWSFVPDGRPSQTVGLLFFPGALVNPVAYAPLLRASAEAGFPAYMVELPRRGAFGGADDPTVPARARALMGSAGPDRWVVAGHSRGAVVASDFAGSDLPALRGLIVIGSSHPRDIDLSSLVIPVTKIVGTRDGLASQGEVEANRHLLPAHTRWIWVEGGNHSQFGWYGFQPGDRRATISASAQRQAMISGVLDALTAATASPTDL